MLLLSSYSNSRGVGSTVGYKLDLGGEPVDGYRVFLGVPLDSVGDRQSVQLKYRMSGLGNSLEEDVVAQVRVRQYRSSGGSDYETALDWRNVEGNGEQVLDIPVDRERVASKGRTYVEWRFARRGGGSGVFVDKGIDLRNVRMEELKVGWYTRVVMSCEEEDNYRFGYNTQEKVNEVSGKGNHYTAPYWEYDPRIAGRWNCDPVVDPSQSPYSVLDRSPIWKNDVKGDDPIGTITKSGHQAGMPGSGTTADLNQIGVKAKAPEWLVKKRAKEAQAEATAQNGNTFGGSGTMDIGTASSENVGRNDAGRDKAGLAEKAVMGWGAALAAPLLGVAAVESGAVGLMAQAGRWAWSASDVGIPKVGSFLFRTRIASAMSDVLAQGTHKGVENINWMQTGSAFAIGNPFVSTLPGSFVNLSWSSIGKRTSPIFTTPTAKGILISTAGNMMGNAASGSFRGGMMEMGKKPNLFFETLGQQYGHQQATYIDEKTNK